MFLRYIPILCKLNINPPQIKNVASGCNWLQLRNQSFFNKLSAEELWRGCTSVSNAGKKRGRGKASGKKNIKDLNRGQVIGVGKYNVIWPGLNAPPVRGHDIVKRVQQPEDLEREQNLIKIREQSTAFKRYKVHPLDRGWTGGKMPGRSIGPPDVVLTEDGTTFDTRVLEHKIVFTMKGNIGRRRRFSVTSVTGNGKGVAGFATAKGNEVRAALRKSKNRAAQKLISVPRFEDRTIYHDVASAFGSTRIFMTPKPEGFGLRCHRAIKTICQIIGIKDLHAKVEGSTNLQHIVKAFFIGLLKQRPYEKIAEEKGLHIVNIKPDNNFLPEILASPTVCRKEGDIKTNEIIDFNLYVMDGKVRLQRKKFPPFYVNTKGYELYLKKREKMRNQDKVRISLIVDNQDG